MLAEFFAPLLRIHCNGVKPGKTRTWLQQHQRIASQLLLFIQGNDEAGVLTFKPFTETATGQAIG